MYKKVLLASSFFALSAAASAGGFVGLSVGLSDYDQDFDKAVSLSLNGGYSFNENFALEASYIDLGDADDAAPPIWTINATGFNFAAVGKLPVGEIVSLFGKAGFLKWDASIDQEGFGEIGSDDGTDLSLGFGAEVNLNESFGLVFEYQMYELDDTDVSNLAVGARINF